jgi:flagellar L-ring protein precursor FlgH
VGVHDIITVIVDEKSEVTQNSRFNRQRNAVYVAQLREWLRINSDGNLDVAATNSPGVNGQLRSQLQSYGQGLSQEGMKYRIAATVVDILPNGTLILEAHKSIRSNSELWEYSLTGRIRSQDVSGNNTVNSENVADLIISKREHGKIQDSTKRGWLQRAYDLFLPF